MKRPCVVPLVVCLSMTAGCTAGPPAGRTQQKLVILGFDGMDPDLVTKWMDEGKLPNMRRIASQGVLRRLETSPSSDSPSAWASFATGVNAGKHDIYDAFVVDPGTYTRSPGLFRSEPPRLLLNMLPIAAPTITSLRGGTSFWVRAGEAGVRSSILTVPITFPPEDVPHGELLSGLPLPDLLGTIGTFSYFSTDLDPAEEGAGESGGILKRLVFDGETARTELAGPRNPIARAPASPDLSLPLAIHWNRVGRAATIEIGERSVLLQQGEWSRWIDLDFRVNALFTIHGMAQLFLIRADQELQVYVSPVNWKPDAAPAAISSPASLSADLFDRLGYYRTLGWAEPTAALNDERLSEQAFMDDLFRAFDDRAQVILQRIDAKQWDLLVGVIESTDRVQHMMWRMNDPAHPLYDKALAAKFGDAIERVYRRVDDFVGEVVAHLEPGTPILIVSDHGFHAFRQSVNLDAWLVEEGFMARRGEEPDWSRTRAYTSGRGQIFLNLQGRESQGIVAPGGEALGVADDLAGRLLALTDPATGQRIVAAVYKAADIYSGPFLGHAPDLQVGMADGYGIAWKTRSGVSGGAPPGILAPNRKKWSGDHGGYDYRQTAGTIISSRPLVPNAARIIDIAPTVLRYFGVAIPEELDGQPLF